MVVRERKGGVMASERELGRAEGLRKAATMIEARVDEYARSIRPHGRGPGTIRRLTAVGWKKLAQVLRDEAAKCGSAPTRVEPTTREERTR
jgi:hypothetical protein